MTDPTEQCPQRNAGLSHTVPEGWLTCRDCGASLDKVPEEPSPPHEVRDAPVYKYTPVPAAYRAEFIEARKTCPSDMDAQAYVCYQHGLEPVGDIPWTLRDLAKLEFVAWRTARETP
jgi:hypothetical protein